MNVFAKFDEIPSMLLQDIKETKPYGHTFVCSDGRMDDGQRENSISSHKHSLRGGGGGGGGGVGYNETRGQMVL